MVADRINRADRDQLLASLVFLLEADGRVRAAWLAGSLGRGDADDLSDLDLWIVAGDGLMAEVIADPAAWVRAHCDASLAFSIPANAPSGGAYAFSLVRCQRGLQQIDWYWAPAAAIERPAATEVLFEREPTPLASGAPMLGDEASREVIVHWCRESLGMAHIAIKGIRRGNPWVIARHLQLVADCVGRANWVRQHRTAPRHDDSSAVALPGEMPVHARDRFRLLRALLAHLDLPLEGLPAPDRAELMQTRESILNAIERSIQDNTVEPS